MQTLTSAVAAAQLADRHAGAAASRAAHEIHREPHVAAEAIVLRRAVAADDWALKGLAALDGAPAPAGDMRLAELDGRIAAAVPLSGGRAIADPFQRTAGVVELLRLRASALAGDDTPGARVTRLRPRLRRLRAAA